MEATQEISTGNARFMVKVYPDLVKLNGSAKNLVMSPFSISSVLALAYAGANGGTQEQMREALGYPENYEEFLEGYQWLISKLGSDSKVTLNTANRLFVSNNFWLLKTYLDECKSYFRAEPQGLDFSKNDKAAAIINRWVEEQTNDKIKGIVGEDELSSDTKLVLVNAVYFKGTWNVPFEKDSTHEKPFYITPDESIDVQMMHISEKYSLTDSEYLDCQILDMPYKGDRLSMLFLLSRRAEGFEEMEKKFASFNMIMIKKEDKFQVDVFIPRFKIETTHKLKEPLQGLGIIDMFDSGLADFSRMSGQGGLSVSSIVQKAFIEVNEEGTEAAAATAMICVRKCLQYNPTFTCNRPFLFAIRDNSTGMILFNGRVVNPLDV